MTLSRCDLVTLPENLNVGTLRLQNSKIIHLPDSLNADILCLNNSSVKSIGSDLKVRTLYLDSTDMLTNVIQCKDCRLEPKVDGNSHELDMQNVAMDRLFLNPTSSDYLIRNAQAKYGFALVYQENDYPCTNTIRSSEFKELNVFVVNGSTLVFENDVTIEVLHVDSESPSIVDCKLRIKGARIDRLLLSGLLGGCRIPELVVHGSIEVEDRNMSLVGSKVDDLFPNNGLVYGDMLVPSYLKLPDSLCCLGTITRN